MPPTTLHAFDDELARLDATDTARAVRDGELSAVEVTAAAVRRAAELDPQLGAVATEDHRRAMERAASIRPGDPRPLAGVPTFVKDNVAVAGLPTRSGSAALGLAGPARATDPVVAQLLGLGVTCLGTSTLPEFGLAASTEFPHRPPTRNPWNPAHTPGGSSGGAAALVAAGVVPLAHGNDGGGSIRIPAACCGLVGLKVTRGRLPPSPEARVLPVDLSVEGVLTRTVRDTARYLAAADAAWADRRLPRVGEVTRPLDRPLRVGVVAEPPTGVEVDGPTRTALADTVRLLEGLGHNVEPMAAPVAPTFAADFTHYWAMLAWLVATTGPVAVDRSFDRSRLTPLTTGLARRFRRHLSATPGVVRRLRAAAASEAAALARVDVVCSPTLATLPPRLGWLGMGLDHDVLFPRTERWIAFTPMANATGSPSISLPLGHDAASGLPVGIMFGAGPGEEALLLALALQLEAASPWRRLDGAGASMAA